jgi:hypothetical protein
MPEETESDGLENTQTLVPPPLWCLYQIKRLNGQNSPWKMGIAAGEVQYGELICWIPEVEKAVIVRINNTMSQIMTIIGTAVVPKEFSEKVMAGDHTKYFESSEDVELGVDVANLYVLMTEGPDRRSA